MTIPSDSPEGSGPGLCSQLSAQAGLPLIGSAGFFERILVFELDAPWTPRLVASRASDAALDSAIARIGSEAEGLRLLAVEPRPGVAAPGRHRVLLFTAPRGAFRRYDLCEFDVAREDLASSLEALAFSGDVSATEIPVPEGRRDILVCTHGARDACCGKLGYPIYREFVRLAAGVAEPLRVWRCSHLGGHRFAPTLLDLPSGRLFGRVTAEDATSVLRGGAALVARVSAIYRGRCALPEPAQIVERDLWIAEGEAIEAAALECEIERAGEQWQVRLEAATGEGTRRLADSSVSRLDAHAVATPASCGRDPETESPWKIVG